MGIDLPPFWQHWPIAELAAVLFLMGAYAIAFQGFAGRRLGGASAMSPKSLTLVGGFGFAGAGLLLLVVLLIYTGQPLSALEWGLLATCLLAMGLVGSGLSITWLRRYLLTGRTSGTGGHVLGAALFMIGTVGAFALYRIVVGGLLSQVLGP